MTGLVQINADRVAQEMGIEHPFQVSGLQPEPDLIQLALQELAALAMKLVHRLPCRLCAQRAKLFLGGEDGGVEICLCGREFAIGGICAS